MIQPIHMGLAHAHPIYDARVNHTSPGSGLAGFRRPWRGNFQRAAARQAAPESDSARIMSHDSAQAAAGPELAVGTPRSSNLSVTPPSS